MSHGNARLTVCGRQLLCRRVCESDWAVGEAAFAAGVSRQTAGGAVASWVNSTSKFQVPQPAIYADGSVHLTGSGGNVFAVTSSPTPCSSTRSRSGGSRCA